MLLLLLILVAPCLAQVRGEGKKRGLLIESNVSVSPPGWAVLEQQLFEVVSGAAVRYAESCVRGGGMLICRTTGKASLDDTGELGFAKKVPSGR